MGKLKKKLLGRVFQFLERHSRPNEPARLTLQATVRIANRHYADVHEQGRLLAQVLSWLEEQEPNSEEFGRRRRILCRAWWRYKRKCKISEGSVRQSVECKEKGKAMHWLLSLADYYIWKEGLVRRCGACGALIHNVREHGVVREQAI